jgi:Tol biopolymer transport system component
MPSEIEAGAKAARGVPEDAIRAQLERILASDVFARAQQLRRFLSFVVEQTLAGESHSLKESVLARELYGKGSDFDGGADPVVRVDARRLRDKLREYYQGRSDLVVISLPKGSYVPSFEESAASAVAAAAIVPPTRPEVPAASIVRSPRLVIAGVALLTIVAAALAFLGFRTSADAPGPQLFPLASYPGSEGPPALSPDGDLVAFAWAGHAEAGPTDIYVKAVGSEAVRQLTDTSASETSPAWSADGQTLAFVRDGQGVFTISQLGGAERQISASGTEVAWGKDSKSVFIRDREGNTGPFGIYQAWLDTFERRRLTQAPAGDGDWRFEVSPDGRTLAFIRYEKRGIADLYTVPIEGGEPRRLSNWSTAIYGLSWTPDGREIVYGVDEPPASRLWRINANTANPGRGSPIAAIATAAVNPSISKPTPGRPARLAFQTTAEDVDIHLMDLEARLVNGVIGSHPVLRSTRIESSAAFSPDGSRIAFVSSRSGFSEMWVAGRDGTGLQQVTSLGASGLMVGGWSPDGSHLVFEAAIGGNTDVFVVGRDGGAVRRLTTEPSIDGVPSWSGDGQWIYFASTRAGVIADIWRVPAKGGEPVRLTRNGGFEPRESPDGRYLVYLDRPLAGLAVGATARLVRLSLDDGSEHEVVEGVRPFQWAVTRNGIVFVTREADVDAIDLYRFADARVVRIGRLGFHLPTRYTYLTASGNGQFAIATKIVRFDSDLMWLDNFR